MLSRVITKLEMRFEHIVLQTVWKIDWRETGSRETRSEMPERVIVNNDESLSRVRCRGQEEEGMDVKSSGTGIDMDIGAMGSIGDGRAQMSQDLG